MLDQDTEPSLRQQFYNEFDEWPYQAGGVPKRDYVQWLEDKVKSEDPYFEFVCWTLTFTWFGILIYIVI
jgi:hypothetical protein